MPMACTTSALRRAPSPMPLRRDAAWTAALEALRVRTSVATVNRDEDHGAADRDPAEQGWKAKQMKR